MDFNIPGDDNELRTALSDVNLPTLLMVMTQFSGDDRWLTDRFRPDPIQTPEGSIFPDDTGNYNSDIAAEIRKKPLSSSGPCVMKVAICRRPQTSNKCGI